MEEVNDMNFTGYKIRDKNVNNFTKVLQIKCKFIVFELPFDKKHIYVIELWPCINYYAKFNGYGGNIETDQSVLLYIK